MRLDHLLSKDKMNLAVHILGRSFGLNLHCLVLRVYTLVRESHIVGKPKVNEIDLMHS